MLAGFSRFAALFAILAVTGVPAWAAKGTTLAQLIMSQDESGQMILTRTVRQVADEMERKKPGKGQQVRLLFTRVLTNHNQPLGEEDFYRELRFIERMAEDGKANLSDITVEWLVRDVMREEFPPKWDN